MKHINFITPLSPNQQQKLHQWFRISCMLYGFAFVCIAAYTIKQLNALWSIDTEKNDIAFNTQEFESTMSRKQKLKQEENELKQKMALIEKYTDSSNSPTAYITTLAKMGMQVASITLHESNLELSAYCTNTQDVVRIHQALDQSSYFKNLKLIAVSPHQYANKNMLRINLRGNVIVSTKT